MSTNLATNLKDQDTGNVPLVLEHKFFIFCWIYEGSAEAEPGCHRQDLLLCIYKTFNSWAFQISETTLVKNLTGSLRIFKD